jgi:hypothetical protein
MDLLARYAVDDWRQIGQAVVIVIAQLPSSVCTLLAAFFSPVASALCPTAFKP